MNTLYKKLSFASLSTWSSQNFEGVKEAFSYSAQVFLRESYVSPYPEWISTNTFKNVAAIFLRESILPTFDLRTFFEKYFDVYKVKSNLPNDEGIFTGYYEPELEGSLEKSAEYSYPLYAPPKDLLFVPDLGEIDPKLRGIRWAGRKGEDGQAYPYWTRQEIYNNILAKKSIDTVICWAKDTIDLFFLHIQGSGKIILQNGHSFRVGYAASNGHAYISLGQRLKKEGKISQDATREETEKYLRNLPLKGRNGLLDILSYNPLFIFFHKNPQDKPIGTLGKEQGEGIPVTSGRSLAVDPLYIPLGLPIWVELEKHIPKEISLYSHRLFIAQDTGGAIKGPVRSDIYVGSGKEAGNIAGKILCKGHSVLLVPKEKP